MDNHNNNPAYNAPLRARFEIAEGNTKYVEGKGLHLADNLERNYPYLSMAARQCPNIHRFRGSFPVDLHKVDFKDDTDPLVAMYRNRIAQAIPSIKKHLGYQIKDHWKKLVEGFDAIVVYEEVDAEPILARDEKLPDKGWNTVRSLTNEQKFSVLFQMCNAVASLHNIIDPKIDPLDDTLAYHSLIHLDIKPGNFLIQRPKSNSDTPLVLLTDFETSTPAGQAPLLKQRTKGVYATPDYVSKEQRLPDHIATTYDDIYALGYTIADIMVSIVEGDSSLQTHERMNAEQFMADQSDYYRDNFLQKLSDEISPKFAEAISHAISRQINRIDDVSEWWKYYLQPALEEYFKLEHTEMEFTFKKEMKRMSEELKKSRDKK